MSISGKDLVLTMQNSVKSTPATFIQNRFSKICKWDPNYMKQWNKLFGWMWGYLQMSMAKLCFMQTAWFFLWRQSPSITDRA